MENHLYFNVEKRKYKHRKEKNMKKKKLGNLCPNEEKGRVKV